MRKSQIAGFILFLFSPSLWGAYSNYNSILIGEQSAGLGGAYTALFGDVAGNPYYNPAGLAWGEGQSFSSSVSIYKKFDTIMGTYEDIVKAPLRLNQGYFQSIPSSSGSIIKVENWFVGLAVTVPDYNTYKGIISSANNNDSILSFIDESLWVGFSAAKKISSNETAGLTVYYTARNYNRTVQDRTINTSTNDVALFSEEKNIIGNSILAILGYQIHWSDDLFFGLSVRTPNLEVSGSGSYFRTDITGQGGTVTVDTLSHPNEKSFTQIPAKLTGGAAYHYGPWLLSADASVYLHNRYYDFDNSQIRSLVNHKTMFNGAIGIEYEYSPQFIIRNGFYTNLTSHEELKVTDKYGDRVDQLGWAANITMITKEKIHFTFGGYYNGGRGKSIQRIDQTYQIIPETQQVFTMLLGTSFSF